MQWVVSTTIDHTSKSLWSSLAHSSQSAWPQTVACRGRAFPCCTNGLPIKCQHSTSAWWRMFLDECLSCQGNTVNTIPHSCRSQIPKGAAADSRPDSGKGSRLFEVNIWMWKYERPFPRMFSVEEAVALRKRGCRNSESRASHKWACKGNKRD